MSFLYSTCLNIQTVPSLTSHTCISMGPLCIIEKSHLDEDDLSIEVTAENVDSIFELRRNQGQSSYWDLAEEDIISVPHHLS